MSSYNTTCYERVGDGAPVTSGQTAVTQGTSITTGVTCSALSGVITTVSQTIAAGAEADFTVTNTEVDATDVISVSIKDHTSAGTFVASISDVSAGSFDVRLANLHASAAGDNVLVLNFIVHKCEA